MFCLFLFLFLYSDLELYIDDIMSLIRQKSVENRLEHKASLLSNWCFEDEVGDEKNISASWMYRDNQKNAISFARIVTKHDLLFRNRLVVWGDEPSDSYAKAVEDRDLPSEVNHKRAHASVYKNKGKTFLHLRDETFSPSRAVFFIKQVFAEMDAEEYSFDVNKYNEFAFYQAEYILEE